MIHGLGGTSNTWTPLLPAFARFQTVRFDLPGSGRSQRVEGPLSIERFVQAAQRVLASTGQERAHIVGHSMGCIVALHMAALEPKSVRSLALFGPLLAPPDIAKAAIRARGEKAGKEGVAGMNAIADALVQAATSAETKAKRRTAVAWRPGPARTPPPMNATPITRTNSARWRNPPELMSQIAVTAGLTESELTTELTTAPPIRRLVTRRSSAAARIPPPTESIASRRRPLAR